MTACKFCGETGFVWHETPKGWRLHKDGRVHDCPKRYKPMHASDKAEAARLTELGYRRISRKFGIVSRVDRPDWKEHMAKEHSPWSLSEGLAWVECLRGDAADQYRRCYTQDKLEVGSIAQFIPTSGWDTVGFVPQFNIAAPPELTPPRDYGFFIDEVLPTRVRLSTPPMTWDFEKTLPDGTVLRTKGHAAMISTPLRDDGPLSSIDPPKE